MKTLMFQRIQFTPQDTVSLGCFNSTAPSMPKSSVLLLQHSRPQSFMHLCMLSVLKLIISALFCSYFRQLYPLAPSQLNNIRRLVELIEGKTANRNSPLCHHVIQIENNKIRRFPTRQHHLDISTDLIFVPELLLFYSYSPSCGDAA
jgi:hypothetical protein